jgi:hypothetical protein
MPLHGTSRQYICQRLKDQGETALLSAVEAGTLSAMAAAVQLGWVKRPPGVGGSTHKAKRIAHQVRAITGEGLSAGQKMELIYGPSPSQGSLFNSREELVAAWAACRDELLERANPGRRPAGFYEFEWDGSRPAYDVERSTLWRLGKLSETEKAELEREWKAAFQEAQADDFTVNDGPGELLHGDCARAAHYAHHDIPRELVKRWSAAARRRRARRAPAPSEKAQESAPGAVSGVRGEEENMGLRPDSNAAAGTLE